MRWVPIRLAGVLGAVAACAAVAGTARAADAPPPGSVTIAGRLDGQAERIGFDRVTLAINGTSTQLAPDGRFSAVLPVADYYQLTIGGPAVFTMVQTFSGEELRDPACGCLAVPPIELVARKPGRVELFFGGDTMSGRRYVDPGVGKRVLVHPDTAPADIAALLRPMQPYYVPSDLASVNLETVLADAKPGGSPNKLIIFYSPLALAKGLGTAGIDYVTLGNNHTYDYLDAGTRLTLDALDAAGVRHSGSGMTRDEAASAARFDLPGNPISLLGFVGWSGYFKPNLVASEGKGGAMHGNDANIEDAVDRERHAGRIPIMQLHTGTEYADEPTEFGVKRMRLAIDEGAPLVVSHHPHVTQGFELYKRGLIAYSMGNFMFDQNFVETMASFTMKAWFDHGKLFRAEVIPIQILDYRPVPAVGSMREASLRRLFALSARRATYFRLSGGHAVVRLDGSAPPPLSLAELPGCAIDAQGVLRRSFVLAVGGQSCRAPEGGTYGRDLMMRGDFENTSYDAAHDRTWGARQASWEIRSEAGGNHYLALLPQVAGQAAMLYTDPYFRKVAGGRYSFVADVRVDRPVTLELAVKERQPEGQKPTAPWKGGTPVGKVVLDAAPGWQRVRIDFTRRPDPGKALAPLRPILSATYTAGKSAGTLPVQLDNLGFIEWQDKPEADLPPGERWLWTHWQAGTTPPAP